MQSTAVITPSTLSVNDLPWQIEWDKNTCTLCGRCTSVCPVNAIAFVREMPDQSREDSYEANLRDWVWKRLGMTTEK